MRFTLALAALAAVLPFGVLGAPLLPRISLTQPFPITVSIPKSKLPPTSLISSQSVARNIAVTPQTFPRAPEPEPAALTGSELVSFPPAKFCSVSDG